MTQIEMEFYAQYFEMMQLMFMVDDLSKWIENGFSLTPTGDKDFDEKTQEILDAAASVGKSLKAAREKKAEEIESIDQILDKLTFLSGAGKSKLQELFKDSQYTGLKPGSLQYDRSKACSEIVNMAPSLKELTDIAKKEKEFDQVSKAEKRLVSSNELFHEKLNEVMKDFADDKLASYIIDNRLANNTEFDNFVKQIEEETDEALKEFEAASVKNEKSKALLEKNKSLIKLAKEKQGEIFNLMHDIETQQTDVAEKINASSLKIEELKQEETRVKKFVADFKDMTKKRMHDLDVQIKEQTSNMEKMAKGFTDLEESHDSLESLLNEEKATIINPNTVTGKKTTLGEYLEMVHKRDELSEAYYDCKNAGVQLLGISLMKDENVRKYYLYSTHPIASKLGSAVDVNTSEVNLIKKLESKYLPNVDPANKTFEALQQAIENKLTESKANLDAFEKKMDTEIPELKEASNTDTVMISQLSKARGFEDFDRVYREKKAELAEESEKLLRMKQERASVENQYSNADEVMSKNYQEMISQAQAEKESLQSKAKMLTEQWDTKFRVKTEINRIIKTTRTELENGEIYELTQARKKFEEKTALLNKTAEMKAKLDSLTKLDNSVHQNANELNTLMLDKDGRYERRDSEFMHSNRETILNHTKYLMKQMVSCDKDSYKKDPNGMNSSEFKKMAVASMHLLQIFGENGTSIPPQSEIQKALQDAHNAAHDYLEAKKSQWTDKIYASEQRRCRKQFAGELMRFCDRTNEIMGITPDRKVELNHVRQSNQKGQNLDNWNRNTLASAIRLSTKKEIDFDSFRIQELSNKTVVRNSVKK